jgi:hypothetical protein
MVKRFLKKAWRILKVIYIKPIDKFKGFVINITWKF